MLQIPTDDGVVLQHSRPDGAFQKKWRINDLTPYVRLAVATSPTDLAGVWVCLKQRSDCWLLPRHDMRFSAGVRLTTIRPCVVIPTCLGELLLLELNRRLSFVVLSSFLDGLCAVRQQFERQLEEGRRACNTGDERVANLRKCREAMNDYSDRVVTEHMEVLPVKWKDSPRAGEVIVNFVGSAVLFLTTPDGHLVDSRDETNVAVLGDSWHVKLHSTKGGTIDAEWEYTAAGAARCISPSGGGESFHTKAFEQYPNGTVNMIRYVRDLDSNTDAIEVCEVMDSEREMLERVMLPVRGGGGATGRWLVFVSNYGNVTVLDTNTGQMAHLKTPSSPSGVIETSEGLWMWGMDRYNYDGWSKLFKVDALESLEYTDPSKIGNREEVVQRRIVDKALDAEAFCESNVSRFGLFRKRSRHPGHYWVVAGYGPVPASLRAPDHIYKELERAEQLRGYRGFPFWSASDSAWLVLESEGVPFAAVWAGAVDVRDGVTAESINEDPAETDIWRVGVPIEVEQSSEHNGEFSVTGNALSTLSSSISFEVPVTAGRWLWRLQTDPREAQLTLWHESVSEVDIAECTTPMELLDLPRFKCRLAQLDALAPALPQEGLKEKIAEFAESVYPARPTKQLMSLVLLDKDVLGKEAAWHALEYQGGVQMTPLPSGVAVCFGGLPSTLFLGENVLKVLIK